ncbi:MAG: ATP/GTP-binding protein [Actinomycetaceae bacterium]|nr:ATP/GTP-binding protein [Actinomycetaceae bacterium]
MGRRRNKHQQPFRPLDLDRLASMPRAVSRRGQTYQVQHLSAAAKTYVCPGCNHEIAPGSPHVVVWKTEGDYGFDFGVEARRHWHPYCWKGGASS